jgi:hypothetical protein
MIGVAGTNSGQKTALLKRTRCESASSCDSSNTRISKKKNSKPKNLNFTEIMVMVLMSFHTENEVIK